MQSSTSFKSGKLMKLGLDHTALDGNGFSEANFVCFVSKGAEEAYLHAVTSMAAKL